MSIMLSVILTFFISNIHGFLCPLTQTVDTHLICNIFHNTNIHAVVADIDFTVDDYCKSGSIYIKCDNPTSSTINIVEMEIIGLNGELDTSNGWPQDLTMIDLEQEWNEPSALFGYWDWNSLKNMNQLWEIDIEDNEFTQTLSNTDWNIIAALPSLTDLVLIGNGMSTNFSKISLNSVSNIEYLELDYNNFYGTMDVSTNGFISKFPQLIYFWISHNDIKGHFNNLDVFSSNYVPNLNEICMENNIFSGQLIMTNSLKFADSLTEFEIDYNEFSGDIDWNIFNHLYHLQRLDINDNAFTGNIDWSIISDLTNNGVLNKIHLENNNFTGYVDFSWMPTGWIDFTLDVDIHCDPIIYPCIGGVTSDRTTKYCYSKSECEASCQCTQTNKPTNKPTDKPSGIPTRSPTKNPTPTPTAIPTTSPTKNPTPAPTIIPTNNPTTPRPTTPDQLFCGDSDTGTYSGVFLTFNVQMAYYADLTFDASQSTFEVTTIEAFSKLNIALGQDTEHDEILTLIDHPPGDYKFIIDGGNSGGTYNVQITCTSDSPTAAPTAAPTNKPTPIPTNKPTPAPIEQHIPIESTESAPSPYPTKKPTALKSVTEIIETTDIISETINDGTTHSSFLENNSFSLILIGMLCALFFIICCMLVLAILIFNNYYKRKGEEHTGIDDGIKHTGIHDGVKHTGIDDFFDGIDNTVMKQLPPIIVPNKNMVEAIWNSTVYNEGLPGPNSVKTCTDMESMYGSVQSIAQHITPTKLSMDLSTIDQLNENGNGEEEYEYEYYYED